jgi:hypothetical protein
MSEDDATALEQEAEAQLAAERETFEARFPPEAFAGIAKALKVRPTPENLSRLSGWLLPHFYFCVDTRHRLKEPTRKERINRIKKLREAAMSLQFSLRHFDGIWVMDWPLDVLAPGDDPNAPGVTDQFHATLQLLADRATTLIEGIASEKSRRGRPSKNEPFRQLTPILVRTYEVVRGESAECPYYLADSRDYSGKGDFHRFALAVWRCLQENLSAEALNGLPDTKGGLAEEFKKHWPEDRPKR